MDLVRHKSRLIMEARLLEKSPRHELAVLLFQQAASIERNLAASAGDETGGPVSNDHLVSAASCYVHSGDYVSVKALLPLLKFTNETRAYFDQVPKLEKAGEPFAARLHDAFRTRSLKDASDAASVSWGRIPPRLVAWPLYRLASGFEALDALRRLVIAYPMDLAFHVLYLNAEHPEPASWALNHARTLLVVFPNDLAAHVSLASMQIRAADYSNALSVCKGMLDIARRQDGMAHIREAMVSTAYATAGFVLRRAGYPDEALGALAEGVVRLPSDPELRTLYALALLRSGDETGARKEVAMASDQVGEENRIRSHWPHTIAGFLALRHREFDEAIRLLKVAARRSKGRAQAHNFNDLGVAYALSGDTANAETSFSAALEANPSLLVAVRNIALLRANSGALLVATTGPEDYMENELRNDNYTRAMASLHSRDDLRKVA